MTAFGAKASFGQELMDMQLDTSLVSVMYGYSFDAKTAKLLHDYIGKRGEELYMVSQIHAFGANRHTAAEHFIEKCAEFTPMEQQERDALRMAFFQINEVAGALKARALKDEVVAGKNFDSAAIIIGQAANTLAKAARQIVDDLEAKRDVRLVLAPVENLLNDIKTLGALRGRAI